MKEADILDCDDRLVGEDAKQLELLLRERLDLGADQQDGAEGYSLAQERRGNHRATAGVALEHPALWVFLLGLSGEIVHVNAAAFQHGTTGYRAFGQGNLRCLQGSEPALQPLRVRAHDGCTTKHVVIEPLDLDLRRTAELRGSADERV